MIKFCRFSVALVWLYEGLWNKILAYSRQQQSILGAFPAFSRHVDAVRITLGFVEVALGIWILSTYRSRTAALAQIVLLPCMNVAGLLFAHNLITDPLGMMIHNTAFLTLAWLVSQPGDRRDNAS